MAKPQINLQDSFLNQVRKESIPITMYLVNGVQLKGLVRGFDNFTVIIEIDGKQSLVYKHAVSTIIPMRQMAQAFGETRKESNGGDQEEHN